MRKFLLERKENVQVKGMISMRMLFFSYTIKQVILNVCTKFKLLGRVVPEKFFDRKKKEFTHRYTHRQTLLLVRQKLYLFIYFVCWRYKSVLWFLTRRCLEFLFRYIGKISVAPWRQCFLMNHDGLNNHSRGSSKKHFCHIILKSV